MHQSVFGCPRYINSGAVSAPVLPTGGIQELLYPVYHGDIEQLRVPAWSLCSN